MKKFISLLILTAMILAIVPVFSAFAANVQTEGPFKPVYDGSTTRRLQEPKDPDEEDDGSVTPLAGYYYDSKGFHMESPIYSKANMPYSVVSTTETYDLTKNNDVKGGHVFSLKFTVDSYLYSGNAGADQWICLAITNKQNVNPGSAEYQDGWFMLIRGNGDGNCGYYPALDFGKSFIGSNNVTRSGGKAPIVDGKETYEFTVDYSEGKWTMKINGTDVSANDIYVTGNNQTDIFNTFKQEAYLNIITQTGYLDPDTPDNNKIEISITEFNSEIPYGDDSAEAITDNSTFAEIEDSSTIPANMPAVKWDIEKTTSKRYSGSNIEFSDNEDGTVHLVTNSTSPYISWGIRKQISYEAADFPVIAVLSRNLLCFDGNCYYCAGEIVTENSDCVTNWDPMEIEYAGGWTLGFIDLTGEWEGRINNIRIGFGGMDPDDQDINNWDIGFMGCFRTAEEATAYAENFLAKFGIVSETTAEETTVAETEAETTKANDETSAESVPNETTVSETVTEETAADSKSGCGGFIGGSSLIAVITLAGFTLKKKH